MAFKPLHDRVLVRRIEGEDKTKGGLIIPDTAKEKPAEGEIVAVGEGARKDSGELIAPSVKAGDRILFGKWSGTEVTLDGEGTADHEGKRHPRHHRLSVAPSDGAPNAHPTPTHSGWCADAHLTQPIQGVVTWLPRT
jgi:chaperonin GroES